MKKTAVLPILLLCSVGLALAQAPLNTTPSRVVGQDSLVIKSVSPNLVEGREFFNAYSFAIDANSTPPALYLADTGNNRVLVWKDVTKITNGQAADFVIGQLDFQSTFNLGPGTARTVGLSAPNAVAVDSKGNLYVVDGGNNRILRYPKPAANGSNFQTPDMVIGQPDFSTNSANVGGISAANMAVISGNTFATSGITFDAQGNLWFSDPLNNRVLRYPVAALNAGTNGPSADLVLGQISFSTQNGVPAGEDQAHARLDKSIIIQPNGLTFDPSGRLYVCDSISRILVFSPPFSTGMLASRLMGLPDQVPVPIPNIATAAGLAQPQGVFMIGNRPAVADAGFNRVTIYDPFEQWPAETPLTPPPATGTTIVFSPAAKIVLGQLDLTGYQANRNLPEPNEGSLASPLAGQFLNGNLYVLDSGNSRFLVFPQQIIGATANRVLGQDIFNSNAPNLVEGKEFFFQNGFGSNANVSGNFSDGAGIVVDYNSNPPHLYVADTFNNRVLGFRDARRVKPGDKADIVMGQPDFSRSTVNYPNGDQKKPSSTGMFHPSGLAVDSKAALWVADTGNGRVLRFPNPFASGTTPKPDIAIGQSSFTSKLTDPTAVNLNGPIGVAFTGQGHLLISDAVHARVLLYLKPSGGDFAFGQAASRVIGQPDFNTVTAAGGNNRFNSPHQISTDTDDRLYVADSGNQRVVVFDRIVAAPNDPQPSIAFGGLSYPQGIYVSPFTGEIWVTNTRGGQTLRYPRYDLLVQSQAANYAVGSNTPLGVTQDNLGNLYVVEGQTERVTIYYNGLTAINAASGNNIRFAPNEIASVFPSSPNVPFATAAASAPAPSATNPLPTTLGDIQVLINGTPAPLYYVSPTQVNLVIPMGNPTSGTADVQVMRVSQSAVLAAGSLPLDAVSPALFTSSGNGQAQVAALNEDGTINSPTNPVPRGKVIVLYGTGAGVVTNGPADGVPVSGATNTDIRPRVIIGTDYADDFIQYSGLAPGFPGMWQINVQIPSTVAPSILTPVAVTLNSVPSNRGSGGATLTTTIAVK
jgi:uncharacterized protein (TIGR03437 family)